MALTYSKNKMGEITLKENGKTYKIQIRQGNCLAVMIYVYKDDDKWMHQLWAFFLDASHMRKQVTTDMFREGITSIKLNIYYKESLTMLKEFAKAGYKVSCYYKKPKASKK